jgi:thioester reductase-like protein
MKVILTGATGVLGSHIMYELLEYFITNDRASTLYLLARNRGKISAKDRIYNLLTSNYAPKFIQETGLQQLQDYIELIDVDLTAINENYLEKLNGAYFIHSAGYVNLSTDENQKEKIFKENTVFTELIFKNFAPFICKFIYISTAFSTGERQGIIENDFHNLNVEYNFRNSYENAKFESEKFIISSCTSMGLPFQILRPSVIGGKMISSENNYFIPKFMVFYLLAKFFYLAAKRSSQQENIRFIVNPSTGLNIIPVDYVAKVIVNIFQQNTIEQLNIVNHTSYNIYEGLKIIMKEVGYTNFTILTSDSNAKFNYQNSIEKLYYESIGKHLQPYFTSDPNEYSTSVLESIETIPTIDFTALKNMIQFARNEEFRDINI